MIPSDHFVRFYNEVFKYLDEKGELDEYFARIAKNQEFFCLQQFKTGGLQGVYDYYLKIRHEENCQMDIVFEDNVVVEALKPICLRVEDGTRLHDVIYRNNRFERCYSGPSAYDLYDTPGFKQECLPYHFFVRKRKKGSKLGSIYDVLLEGNVYEQPFPTEPLVQNPSKARIEFEIKQ